MSKHSWIYGLTAFGAFLALSMAGASPMAQAAPIKNVTPPTIAIVQDDYPEYTPLTQTFPQVGTLLLADPGTWSDASSATTFTYRWTSVAPSGSSLKCGDVKGADQDGNPIQSGYARTAKSYVPINPNIGCLIQVTVTAHNGRDTATATAVTSDTVVGVNPNLTQPQPSWSSTATKYWDFYQNIQPGQTTAYVTFYGYPDNTPPSADIAVGFDGQDTTFPNNQLNQGIHANWQAGGDGSYANPLTLATWADGELAYGTEVYVPRLQKYFIAEDQCTECQADMQGATDDASDDSRFPDGTLRGGDDGGPGLIHFDLWIGGPGGDWPDTVLCEDALTTGDMEPIIINPGPDETVDPTPLFDPDTGVCGATTANPGGVPLEDSNSVGPYQSFQNIPDGINQGKLKATPSENLCITDPDNSVATGTQLTMEECDSSRADQNLSFSGMSMMFNNLCLDMGNGRGSVTMNDDWTGPAKPAPATVNGVQAWPVTLQRCNLNINQQWELGDDGIIGDIQASIWAFADLGDGKLWATNVDRDGQKTYNFWDYPDYEGESNGATLEVTPAAAPVTAGSKVHVVVSGLTTPTANVLLMTQAQSMSGDYSDAINLAKILVNTDGTYDAVYTLPSDLADGRYVITVQGLSYSMPGTVIPIADDGLSTAITSVDQLVVADGIPTLDNFRNVNRTTPVSATSDVMDISAIAVPPAPPTQTVTSGVLTTWAIVLIVIGAALVVAIVASVIGVVWHRSHKKPAEDETATETEEAPEAG